MTRLIADSPNAAKAVLDGKRLTYAEVEIVQAKIQHRPGEIARLASRLRKGTVYINYAYCGLEPETNTLVFFGVTEVGKAASILEDAMAAGSGRAKQVRRSRRVGFLPNSTADWREFQTVLRSNEPNGIRGLIMSLAIAHGPEQ